MRALFHWSFAIVLAVALLAVGLAYQFDTAHTVDVGDYYDRFYLSGFHDREATLDGQQFRWSEAQGTVLFPSVGARGRWLELRLHGWRPAGWPAPDLRVLVNGQLLARFTLEPTSQWKEYRLWVPVQAQRDGTVQVTLETDPFIPAQAGPYTDVRSLGVAVNRVALVPPGGTGFVPGWPAWDQVGWVLLFSAALYLGLAALGLPRWGATLATSLAVAGLSYCLSTQRLWVTIYTSRLAIVALLGLFLLPVLRWIFGHIFAWGNVPAGEREMRILLAIFFVGFLIKAGGLLYPYSVAIDLKWHLGHAAWVFDGRLGQLFSLDFAKSVMPEEWGANKPVIPYSPFYHITAAAFSLFPWRPYDTANVVSVLLDTTRPFLIYFLATRLGLSRRVGWMAGLLYALLPATFLLHSWGDTPTMAGLWWTLVTTCYIVGAWERLRQPRTWIGLVIFLTITLLSYTVVAVFAVVFLVIFLLGLWLNGRALPSRPLGAIALALVAAIGLSTAVFYGQFIRPIIEVTIPYILNVTKGGGTGLGLVPVPLSEYLGKTLFRLSLLRYGLIVPILLAAGSLVLGWRYFGPAPATSRAAEGAGNPAAGRRPLLRWLLIAWFATAFIFLLAGARVDMVDKEHWYAMPAIALCAAITLDGLWRRSRTGQLFTAVVYVFLAAACVQTWIVRLSTVLQLWLNSDAPIVGERVGRVLMLAVQILCGGG